MAASIIGLSPWRSRTGDHPFPSTRRNIWEMPPGHTAARATRAC